MGDVQLIDRIEATDIFRAMLSRKSDYRILCITGSEKMGKSRLMREYMQLAEGEFNAHAALVDLRSSMLSYSDVLSRASEQIGIPYLPHYQAARDDLSRKSSININRMTQILSVILANRDGDENASLHQRDRLASAFINDVQLLSQRTRVVLLFDAFDEAPTKILNWIHEHLAVSLSRVLNVFVVIAGRTLPAAATTWQHLSQTYPLPPVEVEIYLQYCAATGIQISEDHIRTLHRAIDGKPGYFAEMASRLKDSP
jgi:hypothetical protein